MEDFYPRKVSDLLTKIIKPEAYADAEGWIRLFSSWAELTGDVLAAHSRPLDVRNGVFYIEAEHPGWIQLLQMQQNNILKKVKKKFPELKIRAIAFRLEKDKSLPGLAKTETKETAQEQEGQSFNDETHSAGAITRGQSYEKGPAERQSFITAWQLEVQHEGQSSEKKLAETIEAVEDSSFRELLSSLAKTLKENAKSEAKKKK
ncbi:hypothetical protein MASR2M29_03330 [Spirochaetota bacterium]